MAENAVTALTSPPPPGFTILALETSCDETAAAVVRDGRSILANVVASQIDLHRRYGGIVPEVASRQHILSLSPVVQEALAALPNGWDDLHAIAATYGPGLSGSLLVGFNAAKAMAWQRGLPFVGVNHLEAHIYASWLAPGKGEEEEDKPPQFPLIALVVSGGHTLLALLFGHGYYQLLGQTRDDAAGEAFDKVARILELDYPGGPAIQRAAEGVTVTEPLPRAWLRQTFDFSFSGLKTAVLLKVQNQQERDVRLARARGEQGAEKQRLSEEFVKQTAAAFQDSVVDVLVTKTVKAAAQYGAREIILAGGVAANAHLRQELCRRAQLPVRCPPISLCTDNAAMIATVAYYRYEALVQKGWELDVQPNLRL